MLDRSDNETRQLHCHRGNLLAPDAEAVELTPPLWRRVVIGSRP